MAGKQSLTVGVLGVALVGLTACGQKSSVTHKTIVQQALSTPTLPRQVRRAERVGPGFLDYCPLHDGQGKAVFALSLPGKAGAAPGWCRTLAQRNSGRSSDVVTFHAHWDARKINGKVGTYSLTYSIPRWASASATPQAILSRQSGEPPP